MLLIEKSGLCWKTAVKPLLLNLKFWVTFNAFLNIFLFAYNLVMKLYYSSKDILMRVVSQNLSPELTLVEKVCSEILSFTCFFLLQCAISTPIFIFYEHTNSCRNC